jgi:hypothetical protein
VAAMAKPVVTVLEKAEARGLEMHYVGIGK